MADRESREPDLLHQLKNHLAVIVGFCDLLLAECTDTDPRRADIAEVHRAGREAMALMPELSRRMRESA